MSEADPIDTWTTAVHTGDAFDVLAGMPAESVHAVVTDPPYGLAFMGRSWDDFSPTEYQAWCERWATLALDVLKPGGHLLAFSGNRTHHRLFCGVEDAGFEVRDTLTWHYGSGFPKGSDLSKHIDRRRGTYDDREVVAEREKDDIRGDNYNRSDGTMIYEDTEAAHPDARRWEGWKTTLKPATEFVVLARKPFDGAVVDCVLEHGTGALNIDGCRIGTEARYNPPTSTDGGVYGDTMAGEPVHGDVEGRYPANVAFDEAAADRLDREAGDWPSDGIDFSETVDNQQRDKYGEYSGDRTQSYVYDDDHDGPSRYFYTSKASKAERTLNGHIENDHPTVKPVDLMEWLVRLVTRDDQIVLDPFCGTGTTLLAAKTLGRRFVGIERDERWADVARVRVGLDPDDPGVGTPDGQSPLSDFLAADGGDGE